MNNVFFNLMESTGKILSIGELEIADENNARYSTDEVILTLEYLSETNQILVYAFVAEIPLDAPESTLKELYEVLLEGQAFFIETVGASLSISKNDAAIFLQIMLPINELNAQSMLTFFEDFEYLVKYWEQYCHEVMNKEENLDKNNSLQNTHNNDNQMLKV